jgi:hypothetical protein
MSFEGCDREDRCDTRLQKRIDDKNNGVFRRGEKTTFGQDFSWDADRGFRKRQKGAIGRLLGFGH